MNFLPRVDVIIVHTSSSVTHLGNLGTVWARQLFGFFRCFFVLKSVQQFAEHATTHKCWDYSCMQVEASQPKATLADLHRIFMEEDENTALTVKAVPTMAEAGKVPQQIPVSTRSFNQCIN